MANIIASISFLPHAPASPARSSGDQVGLPLDPSPPTLSPSGETYLPSEKLESSCRSFRTSDLASLSTHEKSSKEVKVQPLSTTRLLIAHIGAALTLFLATTDATIVSTSLPTITTNLGASHSQYIWVGVAYMLTQTACQPLYGRLSDLVGRKNVLWTSMTIFGIGSLLCGAAQTITWLIAARGLAGIGGGGIVSSVWVITSEIVDVHQRAKWSQALSITWSCSAIAGPVLGGLFSNSNSDFLNWRWGFYMNIPISLVGFVVLLISLHDVQLRPSHDTSWQKLWQKFDFIGLFLFIAGTSCIVIGFSFATVKGWTAPLTLIPVILGSAVLVCAGLYEARTTREALFPAALFKDLTIVIILIITFLHNFAFNAGTFYLALYFQAVSGLTPLKAGPKLLPYSLGSSLASIPVAWFIGYWQKLSHDTRGQKVVICTGLVVSTLGFGLMNLLNERSSNLAQCLFPLMAGIGLGMLFHAPYQVFIKSLKPHEIATGTGAFFLVRFTGATVGLAVSGSVFYEKLGDRIPPGQWSGPSINFGLLKSIMPLSLQSEVLHAVSTSIQIVWAVCTPCLGLALVISLLLRVIPIEDIHRPEKADGNC